MNSDKQPMTLKGKAQLEEELGQLIKVERPSVIKAIEVARSHGDLSENADYDAAKERQGFVEARISEIQSKIANSEVIDTAAIKSDRIVFGAKVNLLDCINDEKVTYQIVGEDEADVKQGKISIFSPLSRSLIGKRVSDVVEFNSPNGEKEFEILSFEFL